MEEPTLQLILEQEYPGRSQQIQTLLNLMGKPTDPTVPALFVYGHTSSGKTSVLRSLFTAALLPHRFAFINCVECHTPRLVFEHTLNQLTGTVPSHANGYRGFAKCDSLADFVVKLGEVCEMGEGANETRYLILDRAERLRDMSPTLIPVLLRLRELTGKNVCVILVSTIVWDKFRAKTGAFEPLLVRFSEYSKNILFHDFYMDWLDNDGACFRQSWAPKNSYDIMAILAKDCPPTENLPFFIGFVEIVYDIFHRNCKDLNELRHLVSLLFPRYLQPVLDGIAQRSENTKLFRLAQPYFVEATDKLYLREISSAEWTKRPPASSSSSTVEASTITTARGLHLFFLIALIVALTRTRAADFNLPYYTKFLLIAAFLASYNPPRLDLRYFAKVGEENTKKRKGGGARKGGVDKTGGKVGCPWISSLVTLRLLTRTTTADRLDSVKCKCNVGHEFIRQVARGVRFEIDRYLYDFL
ncbi:origin recognition complex subunit 5 C-terminus-domain-containing protein [Jimgerdemannia flammicorona]|uniref:Origin recognition complex subunit 5 n=1 Tax=Jimgerdemannia flammicorona TaxID=994334 RepID=A0A433QIT9_9FUNG|nr:origin recognition complex subunit 5 C-terminus-domain-containing protein [Jimgerdemannia flammicorona]